MYVPSSGRSHPGGLLVRGLRTRAKPGHTVSFVVPRGEILGFAGLIGAGRSEVAEAIFGVDAPLEGEIHVDGVRHVIRSSRDAIAAGIYLAPEDRRRTGLITEMTVRENITMPGLWRHAVAGLIRRGSEARTSQEQVAALRVKTPGVETRVRNLSGGNQQKVVLGKWMALEPKVMIFDEPTRGIDVGSKAEIYRLMRDLAERGVIVILISSDMEEVLGVSDRIAVMHEGRLTGFLSREQFSEEAVMHLAVGRTEGPAAAATAVETAAGAVATP
jgi:ribose transport system ATP-binding protein